ncbi:hypothetical protein GQ43DRAFT_432701 [Delitschia confertaspora ATCC 74209]|uniref:Zn(2)-C6 fungal-type domain-containing protein n=1 Tax=Delitschia confertaspora ATCC 74209 TaxID=1513339 RepID=A0A9P4JIX4_9PLEO|nr:hypothetical protein GQ43DRAFT_432701 [Delitschia confertaspora ATCC 74209]
MPDNPPPFTNPTGSLPKIAIPRLQRYDSDSREPDRSKGRVTRACNSCRAHKIKCSGDTPSCLHCRNAGRECVYALLRKDRLKSVTEQCLRMAALLRELKSRTGEDDAARIDDLLHTFQKEVPNARAILSNLENGLDEALPSTYGTSDMSVDTLTIGTTESPSERPENTKPAGFVGKGSEVHWLRRIRVQLVQTQGHPPVQLSTWPSVPDLFPATGSNPNKIDDFTFYLDAESVDLDFDVDPFEIPSAEAAEGLSALFFNTAHASFPLLPRRPFERDLRALLESARLGKRPQHFSKKMALFNLVFAIGARYSHLTQAPLRADKHDHLIYEIRARAHGLRDVMTNEPDLEQAQVISLFALYYLSNGQISRAWVNMGLAVRMAHGLGLHVRNKDPTTPPNEKETLLRIWWALYLLERLLCTMTGRPSTQVDSFHSVPLPVPLDEDRLPRILEIEEFHHVSVLYPLTQFQEILSSPSQTVNTSTYLKAQVQITIIMQQIVCKFYPAGNKGWLWHDIFPATRQFLEQLQNWAHSLPAELRVESLPNSSDPSFPGFVRERAVLSFYYHSAEILLARPYLERSEPEFRNPKDGASQNLIQEMALLCLQSARAVVSMLPESPDPLYLYETGPWWSIVHHLMQPVAVLLLGITLAPVGSQEAVDMTKDVKKIARWLRAMRQNDAFAERAYYITLQILEAVAAQAAVDVSDMLMEHVMGTSRRDHMPSSLRPPQYATGMSTLTDPRHTPVAEASTAAFSPTYTFPQSNNSTDPSQSNFYPGKSYYPGRH